MTIKLSDKHLVILSTAAGRADRLVLPISENVRARGKVFDAVLTKLLRLELIEVCKLKAGEIGWEAHDQACSPTGLRLAAKGFKALGVLPECENDEEEQGIAKDADDDGPRCVECGAKAEAGENAQVPANMFPPEPDILGPLTESEEASSKTARPVKAGSKEALLLETLRELNGASIFDMMEATGWLPHTCRAALTRLRQKGFAIERLDDPDSGSRYRAIHTAGA
ncbi:MAG: DUF3489 domain-containing protein [Hyphomicrobiales bacterium]